jgi:hypothetical protein
MNLAAIRPALDPLAHRAAIQALETQRTAYARYAQRIDAHRDALGGGSGDRAADAARDAARGNDALEEGARRLAPLRAEAHATGSEEQRAEVQRQVEQMMTAARTAEAAIQNLTAQLEAWRDAYAQQLSEVGITPGAAGAGGVAAVPGAEPAGAAGAPTGGAAGGAVGGVPGRPGAGAAGGAAYGPRGQHARGTAVLPTLLDRKG